MEKTSHWLNAEERIYGKDTELAVYKVVYMAKHC